MEYSSSKERATFVFLASVLRPVMNALLGKEWRGLENIPRGGFIAAPNHVTEIDPVVVGHMLYNQKRPPHFLAKASLFRIPVVGRALHASNQVPVERTTAGANNSLKVAQEVVDAGGSIIIYPEGTLTRDPDLWPMKGHTGAARLALQTGAPVVPIGHWGAQEVFPRYAKRLYLFPRKKVRVLVGAPVDLEDLRDKPLTKTTLTEATDRIMVAVTALVAELRGEEPPAERWDPAAHGQKTTGRLDEDAAGRTDGTA
ncbi:MULTISPECIES: lysophospholipid acyltransferase family protein [Arthrobacter]|uniref:Lysophospholipid acyltransferase family protein n=2 Tax=Arthrobacter TaxID=1663 RepID=A0ABU9KNT5_9MICC|nr:lysophospholipid acyltransferase family protein [Arthrobacter sp. YJM1]MDP5228561.1 lysophospholipid acyltransferase family protein [Arthrobacter sp. YJM1]